MGFLLIERYVFRKVFVTLLAVTASLIGVVWVVRAVQQIDIVMTKGQGLGTYLQMTTLAVPTLAAAIMPIALLLAAIHAINSMAGDSEMIVMHAGGASRKVLLKPLLAAGIVTSLVVYSMQLELAPASMRKFRAFVTEVRADLLANVVREGAFRDIGGSMTFHVASRQPGGVLAGVFLLDGRKPNETYSYLAQTGTVTKIEDETFLVLRDGQIHRLSHKNNDLSIIDFDSYALNMASLSPRRKVKNTSQLELSTAELWNPDQNDPYYQESPGNYRAELHARLTGGIYPLVAVFIIVAFLGFPRTNRQGQTGAAAQAAFLFIAIRVLGILFESNLRKDPDAVFMVWALPIAGIVLPAFYIWLGLRWRLPAPVSSAIDETYEFVASLPARLKRSRLLTTNEQGSTT